MSNMAVCDITIKKDIAPSCDDPIVPGLEQEGVIMNRAEVDFGAVTFNATRKNVIETLALKTGKVNMVVLANDPDVCNDIIDGLANGEFVIVLENKAKGLNKTENPGDSAFQVYGYYQGLKAAEIGNDKYSEETEGGWSISLQETKVPKSALFLYKTSYDATKTLVETLTKPSE